LRFSSYFFFDLLESINVDVSTNGGADWTQVWQDVGEIHDPKRVVLDLSASLAGQANAMVRFRYDTNGVGEGNLWQIDDVELEVFSAQGQTANLPGPADSPNPDDGASGVGLGVGIGWGAGTATDSHDIYFGTAVPLGPGDFQGNQSGTTFDPGPLTEGTTYYWRIDEVNAEGTVRGCTWSFTTVPGPSGILFSDGFEGGG